jgi:tRNA pseudouridine65 synthase
VIAPLRLLYRDDDLLAVDKPSGLAVHRGWAPDGEVMLTLVRRLAGCRVYPVHRLDRGASGVLVMALAVAPARGLAASFAAGTVRKRYLALVRGIAPESGIIDHPIPRSPGGPRVPAVTGYRRLATFERYSWLEVTPETGRLHQIRRHLKHLSLPLIGDVRYGKGEHNRLFRERHDLHRLALHCASISVAHPDGGRLAVGCALAPDIAAALDSLALGDQRVV